MKKKNPILKSFLVLSFCSLILLLAGCDRKDQFLEQVPPTVSEKKQPLQPADKLNSISGNVADALTHLPLLDAKVEIFNAETGALQGWARTDGAGRYSVSNVLSGKYLVRFEKRGYESFQISSPRVLIGGTNLILNSVLSQILNQVSGTVTNSISGGPVPGAKIELIDIGTSMLVRTVQTDQGGRYSISDLTAGTYRMRVSKIGYEDLESNQPGALQDGLAKTVNHLLVPKKVLISGRAYDVETQAGIAGVSIKLLNLNGSTAATASTDADGKYSFNNLYAGTYSLSAELTDYRTFTTTAPGAVLGGNSYTVDAPMQSVAAVVFGKVVNAVNNRGLQGVRVQLINAITGVVFSSVDTDANGQYQMSSVPRGNYTMLFGKVGFSEYSTDQPGLLGNGQRVEVNAALSPVLLPGQNRVVLTWTGPKAGAVEDVDSYLLIPGKPKCPVFYGSSKHDGAMLDVDDTTWKGPETITIDTPRSGIYRYYIANFDTASNLAALGQSDVVVTVYSAPPTPPQQYKLEGGSGLAYEMFTIENGNVSWVGRYNSTLPFKTSGETHNGLTCP